VSKVFIAFRNLIAQRKRYALLVLAIAVGYSLITLMTALSDGMISAATGKAAVYFSGDVSITGHEPDYSREISDIGGVEALARSAGVPIRLLAGRSIYYQADAIVYFGMEFARLRRVVGVDFDVERDVFSKLRLTEGEIPGANAENAVMVSSILADLLGAKVGDLLTFELRSDFGSKCAGNFTIQAIFEEPGFFGYAAYVDADSLNAAIERPEGTRTDIAIFLEGIVDREAATESIRRQLSSAFPVFPRLSSKAALVEMWRAGISRETYSVISLDANLSEIKDFIDALRLVTFAALAVFFTVMMAGLFSTYRIVVLERIVEIGTMRSIGMRRIDVLAMFVCESIGITIVGCTIGAAIGMSLALWVATLDFSRHAALAMLLEGGRPAIAWSAAAMATAFSITCVCNCLAALLPAARAVMMQPADELRKEAK
jgi:putative ABC transport system permease protein